MRALAALAAILLLSGCALVDPDRTMLGDVVFNIPRNLIRECPTSTPFIAADRDVTLRMIGTPGHRLATCGTLAVQTIQVVVPRDWKVVRWERIGGRWRYAFLFDTPAGQIRRSYQLGDYAGRYRFELNQAVRIRWFRAARAQPATKNPNCPVAVWGG